MSFIKEFKEFAIKGNVMDMAVGVIIGGAFGKIVSSLVNDVIMPVVGLFIGGVDFKGLKYVFSPGGEIIVPEVVEVALNYGVFIQNVFDFFIIALCIFMMVKGINLLKKEEKVVEEEVEKSPTQEELLAEIRDLLKK